jgi:polyhydroxybutyrate depolymerase
MQRRSKTCILAALVLWVAALPLLVSCAFNGPTVPEAPQPHYSTLVWNGIDRTFATYAPANLAEPAPLVLLLHGGFSSASDMWETELAQSWKTLADHYGFLFVLPEGAPDAGDPSGHHWNDCRVDAGNADSLSTEDDVGFIGRVIDVIAAHVAVDLNRVYITGASNGGMMTFRLAMQLGDRFAAAAAVIANLPDPSECPLSAPALPILIMNGTADPVMPYDGGCVAGSSCQRGSVRSTAATVAFWVLSNGASTSPVVADLPDTVPSDNSTVRVFRFADPVGGNDVVLYRVEGGSHCAPGPSLFPATGKNRDIDAATEIWGFFQAHVRPTI